MKNLINKNTGISLLAVCLAVLFTGCERLPSDDVVPATYPNTADIFTDDPVSLTDAFFISFDPAGGANTNGFDTDDDNSFEGERSIKIAVPSSDDPDGGFIGGIFKDRGNGRDLTEYDAMTFWAKGSTTATVGLVGFGTDFEEDKYAVSLSNLRLSTNWTKYTVPMPDPSKLVQEKGMFIFSAGSESTEGNGYNFWIDELRFEKLGTIAQPRPAILSGEDQTVDAFIDQTLSLAPLTQTFNLADGTDQTVTASSSYFMFESSNTAVATVDSTGTVTVLAEGESVITASLAGVSAAGSLTLNVIGNFNNAPIPTRPAANVISVFSNVYTDVSGLNIAEFNNAEISIEVSSFNGDDVINYGNLGFVGIGWDNPLDVSSFDFLHVDVQVDQAISAGNNLIVELNAGGGADAGGFTVQGSGLVEGEWIGVDIPVNGFTSGTGGGGAGSPTLSNINNVIFVGGGINSVIVDNIYFYKQ